MTKHEARSRGLKLAAKLTGIAGLVIVATSAVDARGAEAPGESILKGHPTTSSCGCAPCWGPPAPPAFGVAS